MKNKFKIKDRVVAGMLAVIMAFAMTVMPVDISGICGIAESSEIEVKAASNYSFSGTAHIQTYADTPGTFDESTGVFTLGTTGQAKRLEQVTINFKNNTEYTGSIRYRVHRQTYGWTKWVENGEPAGTTGEAKRLEGIQIALTGAIADHYSIKYRVHIQTYGWNQGWQYDGALAGTEGEAKRLECLEIMLVPKDETMGVSYRVHRQTYGWETKYAANGEKSGTTGEAKRLEGIEIALTGNKYSGSITYTTHVQSYGWLESVSDGMMSGTTGQAKRLEAIKISLTGDIADHYDVYYRVHAQTYGWLNWAKNGEAAGTAGLAKRLEAIQIVLVAKGSGAPASTYKGVTNSNSNSFVSANDVEKTRKAKTAALIAAIKSKGKKVSNGNKNEYQYQSGNFTISCYGDSDEKIYMEYSTPFANESGLKASNKIMLWYNADSNQAEFAAEHDHQMYSQEMKKNYSKYVNYYYTSACDSSSYTAKTLKFTGTTAEYEEGVNSCASGYGSDTSGSVMNKSVPSLMDSLNSNLYKTMGVSLKDLGFGMY